MKFIKKMFYDENSAWYIDKAELMIPAIIAVTAFAVAGIFIGIGVRQNAIAAYILAGAIGAFGIAAFIRLCYRARFPYNVVVDEEYLYIRKGAGYLKIHKFDIGSVVYQNKDGESAAEGHGTEHFTIERTRITFRNAIKPIKQGVRNGEKLAYVLISIVQNPHSGIDWSVAYDSLPAGKRSPGAF